jgi:hypothetical protein
MYKKQHFFTITEISVRTLFFSHRTEILRNYARFDEQIKKKFEKWFGLWQLFGLCHEPAGPLLGCFPSFSFVFPVFTVLNRKTLKQAKNHHRTKKTKKTEKNQKSSPDPKMHRTVAKTVLHTCLATGTSNAHAVVLQQKNVQKTPFLTPKTVLFGPPISDPGPLVTHKTAKI